MKIQVGAYITTVFLLFFVEWLQEQIILLNCLLFSLACLSLRRFKVSYPLWESRSHAKQFEVLCQASRSLSKIVKWIKSKKARMLAWLPIISLSIVFFCFIWTPFYFSDDALRHIHDGFYLQSGIDVYTIPPQDLRPVLAGKQPNHPEVPSIYLPVTQVQAMLGAALPLPSYYGFRLVYISICVILMCCIWGLCPPQRRQFYLHIFLAPWFCIFLAGHHADLQGFLLLLCIGLGLKKAKFTWPNQAAILPRAIARFYLLYFFYFAMAFLAGLMVGLKPEGIWLFLCLHVWVIYDCYITKKGKYLLCWLGGSFLCLLLQVAFARLFLWPNAEAFYSFLSTSRFFADWFLAYNPILELRTFFYEKDILRPEIFSLYRKQIFILGSVCFFMLAGLFLSDQRLHKLKLVRLLSLQGRITVYLGLVIIIMAKGVWHPWYFLWLIGVFLAFHTPKKENYLANQVIHFISASLLIFYLPVIQLRAQGVWQMSNFYFAFIFLLLFWIFLTWRNKSIYRKRQIVSPLIQ